MTSAPTSGAAHESPEALPARELIERLAWIVRLRWVAAAGVAIVITVARWYLGIALPVKQLYAIVTALAAYNAALWGITRSLRGPRAASGAGFQPANITGCNPVPPMSASALANAQIAIDLFFLAALLYFSGGVENPLVFYFVFHIVIASILLSRAATYFQAALASLLVAVMAVTQSTPAVPHYHLVGVMRGSADITPMFAFAVSFAVTSTLVLTAYFATSITSRLRQREREILALTRSLERQAADLSEANDRLRLIERAKSEYMRRVAHELRSPLGTVQQMLEVVLEGRKGEVPAGARETLARARVRLRLLTDVARDLLVLSRAREADFSQHMQAVNLADVVAALAPDLGALAQGEGVTLEIAVPQQLPPITGDPESLAQLVRNLATNAIKYTPAGGRVAISGLADRQSVELTVADSGIGIPQDELPRVFGEFYRAANARASAEEGTGLGLAIVKAICESHHAEVSAESELGCGTTFRVRFPSHPQGGDAAAGPDG
jgi:signal transduction histidine kinase